MAVVIASRNSGADQVLKRIAREKPILTFSATNLGWKCQCQRNLNLKSPSRQFPSGFDVWVISWYVTDTGDHRRSYRNPRWAQKKTYTHIFAHHMRS